MTRIPADAASVAFWLSEELEQAGVATAISGALALALHGVPRMTKDADLAVFVDADGTDAFLDALERAGCLFDRDRARRDLAGIGWFWVRCGKVEVDLFVARHPFQLEAMRRRVRRAVPGHGDRWFHSAEDLAVYKLALLRQKDIADLELLFAAQGARLDVGYIRRWIDAITPPGDPRRAALDELERRFGGD